MSAGAARPYRHQNPSEGENTNKGTRPHVCASSPPDTKTVAARQCRMARSRNHMTCQPPCRLPIQPIAITKVTAPTIMNRRMCVRRSRGGPRASALASECQPARHHNVGPLSPGSCGARGGREEAVSLSWRLLGAQPSGCGLSEPKQSPCKRPTGQTCGTAIACNRLRATASSNDVPNGKQHDSYPNDRHDAQACQPMARSPPAACVNCRPTKPPRPRPRSPAPMQALTAH